MQDIFGAGSELGATIVDALDTLHIMGFNEEFEQGKNWIIQNLNMNIVNSYKLCSNLILTNYIILIGQRFFCL